MRHKDSADVLMFGADLLKRKGSIEEAYYFLNRACVVLQGRKD